MTLIEEFWSRTQKVGTCIVWAGSKNKAGYGIFHQGKNVGSRTTRAHRFILEHVFGLLPKHIEAMHSCDNPACVTLQHLSPGTHAQNIRDAVNKGRVAHGESNGISKFSHAQIDEIRRRREAGESHRQLAKIFETDSGTISLIVRGKTWARSFKGSVRPALPQPSSKAVARKLTWAIVDEIRASMESGVALAKRFDVTPSMICRIRKGKAWKR